MGERADFGTRFIAWLIDYVIVGVAVGIIYGIFGAALGRIRGIGGLFLFLAWLLSIVVVFGYFIFFWTKSGQTIGKQVMKIKVVTTQGQLLNYGQAALRVIGYWVSSFIFCLGFLWMLWDPDKQTWADKIAGTYVVKA